MRYRTSKCVKHAAVRYRIKNREVVDFFENLNKMRKDILTGDITAGPISKKGLDEKLCRKFLDEAKALCRWQHPGRIIF